jgi:hypothetical protein
MFDFTKVAADNSCILQPTPHRDGEVPNLPRKALRCVRRTQAMKLLKLLLGFSITAFVVCAFAFTGPSTGTLLAEGTAASLSSQSGGASALQADALFALGNPNPDATLNRRASNKLSNKSSFRRAQVVQDCKPSGANCTLPGECCSNSCLPPGFGGQPTCQ